METLLDILRQLVDAHRELIAIGEQKKEAIIHNQIDQVSEQVNRETRIIRQMAELEKQRLEATMNFLISRGYSPNPQVTLSNLIQLVFKAADKQALYDVRDQLIEATGKLKQIQQVNQDLLTQSLEYIEFSLNMITGYGEEDATYSHPSQRPNQSQRPGFFDTRA